MDPEDQLQVLVVDDEPGIVDVTSMALRHRAFIVATAETGGVVQALRELRPTDIDGRSIPAEGRP